MPAIPTLFVVTTSEYGTDRNHPVLPTRVVESDYRGDSRIEHEYTVTEADYTIKPDPAQFGLQGLDLPPGVTVIDDRINRVAGYWQARTPAP